MNLSELPADLPAPQDDGAAEHLTGMQLPAVSLPATNQQMIALNELAGCWVLYVYPMTGRPDEALPTDWDKIPGARGCTPQACTFRDHYAELQALGVNVYGISSQSSEYQLEARARLHLPFELLSDVELKLHDALHLPIFEVTEQVFYKRLTLIIEEHHVIKTFYPVFPPTKNAAEVIEWLRQ